MFLIDLFNKLDIASRVFIAFLLVVATLIIIGNIYKFIKNLFLKSVDHFYSSYKSYSENKFNTILIENITKKLKATNKFLVYCTLDFKDPEIKLLDILPNFTQAFSNYFKVKITYEKNNLTFLFEDFSTTINQVIDQFYVVKKSREKQYKGLKIYISMIELEDETKINEHLYILKSLNNLKLDKKILCNSSFKFYYNNLVLKKYETVSHGDYLLNQIYEIFSLEPSARTL